MKRELNHFEYRWNKEKEVIQDLLNQGKTHLEISKKYKVTPGCIDTVVKKLGLVRNFQKFKVNKSSKKRETYYSNNPSNFPMPLKYVVDPFITKARIVKFRANRGKYSFAIAHYLPECQRWVLEKFSKVLGRIGMTFDEWECKWELKLSLDYLYSSLWVDKVVDHRFSDKPKDTRDYIKSEYLRGNYLSTSEVFITKTDLINQYYESRKDSRYKTVEYDFSKVPEVIKSCREKFTLVIKDPTDSEKFINYSTDYHTLVVVMKDQISFRKDKTSVNRVKTLDEFIQDVTRVYGPNRYDFSKTVYINNKTPLILIDKELNKEFEVRPDRFLSSRVNYFSKESIGERIVRNFLENTPEITFKKSQLRIKGLIEGRNTDVVYIDFVVEYDNKTYWIEYNGKQHYNSRWYSLLKVSKEDFLKQKKRDNNVREYCKKNEINLVEVPYILKTYKSISEFLRKVIIEGVDQETLIDYSKLYEE